MKFCNTCREDKDLSEFSADKRKVDGKCVRCKVCSKAAWQRWYAGKKEHCARYNRRRYEQMTERYAAQSARYYAENRDKVLEYYKEWKAENVGKRPADKPWPATPCGYDAAHKRVFFVHGPASWHPCIDCGAQAEDWSYRGSSDAELVQPRKWGDGNFTQARYSPNPDDYDPRCKVCHKKYDLAMI